MRITFLSRKSMLILRNKQWRRNYFLPMISCFVLYFILTNSLDIESFDLHRTNIFSEILNRNSISMAPFFSLNKGKSFFIQNLEFQQELEEVQSRKEFRTDWLEIRNFVRRKHLIVFDSVCYFFVFLFAKVQNNIFICREEFVFFSRV